MRSFAVSIALHGVDSLAMIERDAASALPPGTLMARAGEAAARWIIGRHPLARDISIWCGPGNNGGDGYACALALHARGRAVHCIACAAPSTHDARQAAERWSRAGGVTLSPARTEDAPRVDLLVDAMFGIGLARPLVPPWSDWVDAINRSAIPVLALDIPSGLDADRGWRSAGNGRGPWWNAGASHMNAALPVAYFTQRGLVSLVATHRRLQCVR
jgi:NAD(P)H-hydrate epimerase